MPLDWKLLIILAAIIFVACGLGVVAFLRWLTGFLTPRHATASFDEQDLPEPVCVEPDDGTNYRKALDELAEQQRAGGDLFAEDLLAEVSRVQQDPLALVPLPRLESERGGIPCGQLYPRDETGGAA